MRPMQLCSSTEQEAPPRHPPHDLGRQSLTQPTQMGTSLVRDPSRSRFSGSSRHWGCVKHWCHPQECDGFKHAIGGCCYPGKMEGYRRCRKVRPALLKPTARSPMTLRRILAERRACAVSLALVAPRLIGWTAACLSAAQIKFSICSDQLRAHALKAPLSIIAADALWAHLAHGGLGVSSSYCSFSPGHLGYLGGYYIFCMLV